MDHAAPAVWLLHGLFGMYGLVVSLGTNDWGAGVDLEDFSRTYRAFLAALPPSLHVACMGMTWSAAEATLNTKGNSMDEFPDAIRATCTAMGKVYLDGKDAIPHSSEYFRDGFHPNDRGHRFMGAFLVHRLRELGWLE